MTTNLTDRPPKISGLITVKQLGWTVLAGMAVIPVFVFLPVDIVAKILISLVIALPILVIGWFPESQTSPVVFVKSIVKKKITRQVRTHSGDTKFYSCAEPVKTIKRYKEYVEIK